MCKDMGNPSYDVIWEEVLDIFQGNIATPLHALSCSYPASSMVWCTISAEQEREQHPKVLLQRGKTGTILRE